jgi:hypothetical protein
VFAVFYVTGVIIMTIISNTKTAGRRIGAVEGEEDEERRSRNQKSSSSEPSAGCTAFRPVKVCYPNCPT